MCIALPTSRECGLEKRAVQIGTQPVPARFEKLTVLITRKAFRIEAVQRSAKHDTGTRQREFRERSHLALCDGPETGVGCFTPLFQDTTDGFRLT